MNMKYALIGCGRIAANHVKAVLNNGLEFIAACDIVPENIEVLLEKHDLHQNGSILKYTDYKKMIEQNPDIELIAIATSSGNHAEIALYCIDQGINVIIEKPMAMSIADADEIIKRSEEKGDGCFDDFSNAISYGLSILGSAGSRMDWCRYIYSLYPAPHIKPTMVQDAFQR